MTDDELVRQQLAAIERGAQAVLHNVGLRPDEVAAYEALASKTVIQQERPRIRLAFFALLAVRDVRRELGHTVPNVMNVARLSLQAGVIAANLGINLVTSAKQRKRGRESWTQRRMDPSKAADDAALRRAVVAARKADPAVKDRTIASDYVGHISPLPARLKAIDRTRKRIVKLDLENLGSKRG